MFRLYVYERLTGRHRYSFQSMIGLRACVRVCRALPDHQMRAYELIDGHCRRLSVRNLREA